MRIALFANPENIHTRRWIDFLADRGHELLVVVDPHVADPDQWVSQDKARWVRPAWNLFSNVLAFRLTPKPHGNSLWKGLHYRDCVHEFAPDVIHGFEAYYSGGAIAACSAYPSVLTPWGKDVHADVFRGPLWRHIITKGLRAADRISTNDESLPDWLTQQLGVPAGKIRAFSWGADLETFRPRPAEELKSWRERLKLDAADRIILSPRKFDPYWGGADIIEAIPKVLSAEPRARFIILTGAASPEFMKNMKDRAETLEIQNSIRWIDEWVSPESMSQLYSLAEIFVSIPQSDLLAMTIIEGLACGCYPVAADLPAYKKHLRLRSESGQNAVLMDMNSGTIPATVAAALTQALGSPETLSAARKFNVARMQQMENAAINMIEMETVYAEAIEAHGK